MNAIPAEFAQHMIELHGEPGATWVETLPSLLEQYAKKWSLQLHTPFGLSYNYVVPATRTDGSEVVLKAGVPHPELDTEIEALRLYDGQGMVQLLEVAHDDGIFLIERVLPGSSLWYFEDDTKATEIAAGIMQRLWRPAPAGHSFPTTARWAQGLTRLRNHFAGGVGSFPKNLVEQAETIFETFLASPTEPVLLHGDLHHGNILQSGSDRWLAIDPKGLVGEADYEVGAFLRNPMPDILQQPDVKQRLNRRIDIFTEILGFERERILGWALAQAVLSAWWDFEDTGHGWETGIAFAEIFAAIEAG